MVGDAVENAFKMSDTNKAIKIKLLGITDSDVPNPVSFFILFFIEKNLHIILLFYNKVRSSQVFRNLDSNHSHFVFLDRNIKILDYTKKLQNKLYNYANSEEPSNHSN